MRVQQKPVWMRPGFALLVALAGGSAWAGTEPVESAGREPEAEAHGRAPSLRKGSTGPEVRQLYEYLKRFGYFPNDALRAHPGWTPLIPETPKDLSRFDDLLERALIAFQKAHGLPADGTLNAETAALMSQPRCGFPDNHGGQAPASFVASPYRWSKSDLSYAFTLYTTPDLSASSQKAAVRTAFARWAAVTALTFSESTFGYPSPSYPVDINVSFNTGDHGDGHPFDGAGNVLAHAWYPDGSTLAGDIHFDDAETWSVDGSGTDLESIALHEIGHSIGLAHSSVRAAVMYAFYSSPKRNLTQDDVSGIQSIYGPRKEIAWSSSGPISGMYCKQITEPLDPSGWSDNYLCFSSFTNVTWSSSGNPGGRCTQLTEGAEPASTGWGDNYLCLSSSGLNNLYFTWSSSGPLSGKCVMTYEFSDPHSWNDNFLCYTGSPNPY